MKVLHCSTIGKNTQKVNVSNMSTPRAPTGNEDGDDHTLNPRRIRERYEHKVHSEDDDGEARCEDARLEAGRREGGDRHRYAHELHAPRCAPECRLVECPGDHRNATQERDIGNVCDFFEF